MTHTKKVVLAFSGGLDTTYCAIYLKKELNCEIHAITINTGGFSNDEIARIEAHAYKLGVASFKCVDARNDYYQDVIKYLVFGNVLKNNTYPLSVSAERLSQAIHIAEHVRRESELLKGAHQAGIPLFGVCFGHKYMHLP